MRCTNKMIEVMQAKADGKKIERQERGRAWNIDEAPYWDWFHYNYRVAVTKPSINWEHVSDEWNFMATDESGETFLYSSMPLEGHDEWHGVGELVADAMHFSSFKPGTCDWKDSLVERPVDVNKLAREVV